MLPSVSRRAVAFFFNALPSEVGQEGAVEGGGKRTLQQIQRQRNLMMLTGSSCFSLSLLREGEREGERFEVEALSRDQCQTAGQDVLSVEGFGVWNAAEMRCDLGLMSKGALGR